MIIAKIESESWETCILPKELCGENAPFICEHSHHRVPLVALINDKLRCIHDVESEVFDTSNIHGTVAFIVFIYSHVCPFLFEIEPPISRSSQHD